ncbi:MAG: hypothetical protein JWN76_2108, partial [Chitinophagaceae bacterium]|nr:hypothetical protein [Chitinophagaceae bacterium]
KVNPVISRVIISHKKALAGSVIRIVSSDGKMIREYNPLTESTQSIIHLPIIKAEFISLK